MVLGKIEISRLLQLLMFQCDIYHHLLAIPFCILFRANRPVAMQNNKWAETSYFKWQNSKPVFKNIALSQDTVKVALECPSWSKGTSKWEGNMKLPNYNTSKGSMLCYCLWADFFFYLKKIILCVLLGLPMPGYLCYQQLFCRATTLEFLIIHFPLTSLFITAYIPVTG